jgi:hypothetical protein
VFREDLYNSEFVQRGIESGARTSMVVQTDEVAIRHGLVAIERAVAGPE